MAAEQPAGMLARLKIMFALYTFRRCERGRGLTAERVTGERLCAGYPALLEELLRAFGHSRGPRPPAEGPGRHRHTRPPLLAMLARNQAEPRRSGL